MLDNTESVKNLLEPPFLYSYVAAFVLVIVLLYVLNPIATKAGLVDRPDGERKQNQFKTPLTGGVAIYVALLIALSLSPIGRIAVPYPTDFWPAIAFLLAVLVITHMLDDIFDINAVVRLALDGAIGVLISTVGLLQISTLGYLFGPTEMTLGRWAIAMTIFSFIAASNAFNMTDGIDGLCSGLGIICYATIIALILQTELSSAIGIVHLCMVIILSLLAMYLCNLGYFSNRLRAFLGDSGARLIGFFAAIVLCYCAKQEYIAPVMVYFPIAVPVCDCLILMGARIIQKRSPLSADRLHLHHLLLDSGFNHHQTRAFIFLLALGISAIGYCLQAYDVTEWKISICVVLCHWSIMAIRRLLVFKAKRMIGTEGGA